jgi:hypothetical protein
MKKWGLVLSYTVLLGIPQHICKGQDGINVAARYISQEKGAQVGIVETNLWLRKRGAEDVFAGREVGQDQ